MCFAIMTGAYSTAVKGDGRVFAEVIAIRSVDSKDVMTSEWTRIPHEVLHTMSSRIVNEVPNVSRVVYDITTNPSDDGVGVINYSEVFENPDQKKKLAHLYF